MKLTIKKSILILCGLCMFCAGCANQSASANQDAEIHENDIASKIPDKEEITHTILDETDLVHFYQSIEDLESDSESVIYGEVEDYSFSVSDGIIYTTRTVKVLETLDGTAESGEVISVDDMGGVCLIRDYIESFKNEDMKEFIIKDFTDEETDTSYIQEIPDGYFYPHVGDRSVFFLTQRFADSNFYEVTGGWQGEYKEIAGNSFCVTGLLNELSTEGKLEDNVQFSYEELKEQILEAAGKLQEN